MNKIKIIIAREFLTRVRKKSFIIMTLLTPVLFAALMFTPMWLVSLEDDSLKQIAVLDSSQLFIHKLPQKENLQFTYCADVSLDDFKRNLDKTEFFGILYIPDYVVHNPNGVEFYSHAAAPNGMLLYLNGAIEKILEKEKLLSHGIENIEHILSSVRTNVNIRTFRLDELGHEEEEHSVVAMVLSYLSAFLIYLFVFMFGSMVMRGVIEEKSNRVVEVIICSVKPFELMMGKVIGIAFVGLTQFVMWVVLTFVLVSTAQMFIIPDAEVAVQQIQTMQLRGMDLGGEGLNISGAGEVLAMLSTINFPLMLGAFLFFFIGGYLLYASLFAAVGSLVDSEADTTQFILPITVPMLVALMVMVNTMQNPDGTLATVFSLIPFTSPVVMMARIPFGVGVYELGLSMVLLVITFIGSMWLSGKIYRTSILMYGKKITYREIWRWFKR